MRWSLKYSAKTSKRYGAGRQSVLHAPLNMRVLILRRALRPTIFADTFQSLFGSECHATIDGEQDLSSWSGGGVRHVDRIDRNALGNAHIVQIFGSWILYSHGVVHNFTLRENARRNEASNSFMRTARNLYAHFRNQLGLYVIVVLR